MVFGGGVSERQLSDECGALTNEISALIKGLQGAPLPLQPHEDAVRE